MVVAALGVHSVQAQTELPVAGLYAARPAEAARIGVVAHVDVSADLYLLVVVRQWGIVQQNDTAHGAETVTDALCSLHHFHHARPRIVELGRMIGTPALALQTHTIVHQENTAAVHSLYNRLCNCVSRTDGTHAGDGLKQFRQGGSPTFLQCFLTDGRRLLQHACMAFLCCDGHVVQQLGVVFQLQCHGAIGWYDNDFRHRLVTDIGDRDFYPLCGTPEIDDAAAVDVGDRRIRNPLTMYDGTDERIL